MRERLGPGQAPVVRDGSDEPVRPTGRPVVLLEDSDDVTPIPGVDIHLRFDFPVYEVRVVREVRVRPADGARGERAGAGDDSERRGRRTPGGRDQDSEGSDYGTEDSRLTLVHHVPSM